MISTSMGSKPSDVVTVLGSDDGETFWVVQGKVTGRQAGTLRIDLSSRGGPARLDGHSSEGRIEWSSGSCWTKIPAPQYAMATIQEGELAGVYADPNHVRPESYAGVRMISYKQGDKVVDISIVGTDDGLSFWSLKGKFTDKEKGAISINFSPKGGPSDLTATYEAGVLTFADGNTWTKQQASSSWSDYLYCTVL